MSKRISKRTRKTGLPPGTLVHIGEQKVAEVKITVIDYDDAGLTEKPIHKVEECFPFRATPTVSWIYVEGLHQVEVIETLGKHFGVHPLVLEDILNTEQRPKLEDFEDYIFIVLKFFHFVDGQNEIAAEQLAIVFGFNFLISFQERESDIFKTVRERLKNGQGRLRKHGSDYLAFTLVDAVVDHYFVVLEKLEDQIEQVEERLIADARPRVLTDIHHLKRETIRLRKSAWPLREVIGNLQRLESKLVSEFTDIYLRDLYDHVIQVIDNLETYREILSAMTDIYLTKLSNRMNAIMKILTIISSIFIPLTFIAGIYGMNFKYMPELEWRWGYFMILSFMILIGLGMLFYFKKKKWFEREK
jgi:magnesium transporter